MNSQHQAPSFAVTLDTWVVSRRCVWCGEAVHGHVAGVIGYMLAHYQRMHPQCAIKVERA